MFKFLHEIIWGSSEEQALDDAFKTLARAREDEKPEKPDDSDDDDSETNIKYQISHETGTITDSGNNSYEIDHKYKFQSDEIFTVGTKVSFTVYKDGNKINNVQEIVDEWGEVKAGNGEWHLRTINVQVTGRCGRKLIADPGNIEIDLNKTKSEFVPIVGDFIELETKSEIDESVINLNGKIIEIVKIRPARAQMKEGYIKSFNEKRYTGVINKDIFFNMEALLKGYIPKVGDKVVAEIIESNQFEYIWRAVKIVLQHEVKSNRNQFENLNTFTEYVHSLDGIRISENVVIKSTNFNESQTFKITVINDKYEDVILKNVTIEGSLHQTKLLGPRMQNHVINPCQTLTLKFSVTPKSSGKTQETVLFHFDAAIVGRVVTISMDAPVPVQQGRTNVLFPDKNSQYGNMKRHMSNNYKQAVRGESIKQGPRFRVKKLSDWRIPTQISNVYFQFEDAHLQKEDFPDELKRIKPCLLEHLTLSNYEDRFHTLVYLEELEYITSMRKYDLDRACFIVDGSFLILEMPGLAENRPSVIVGDKIIATCLETQTLYEGCVHKSMGNHLKLKFSSIFHLQYKGEDYKIHVEASRSTFRREHQAVFLAAKLLGDLLFPSHSFKKNPQVKFTYEPYEDIISTTGTKMKIRKAPKESLDVAEKVVETVIAKAVDKSKLTKIELIKRNNAIARNSGSKLLLSPCLAPTPKTPMKKYEYKLEWFDKSLNYYQKEAVRNILLGESRPLPYIIFGPPGTGKTVTIIECILQIVRMISHSRLLIATPSNSAANLITMRLIQTGTLRPGDLVRIVSYRAVQDDSLPPSIIPYCATASIAREGTIADENFVTEKGYVEDMTMANIGRHRITIGTCSALGVFQQMDLKKGHFTHIIVDEAGQCNEPEIMIPLTNVDTTDGQIILAGDPMQLGPVVLSPYAKGLGLEETYMDRLIHRFPYIRDTTGFPDTGGYDPRLVTKLIYNYRALPELLCIPNSCFYHDELRSTISDTDSEESEFLQKLKEMLPPSVDDKVPSLVFHGINGINQRGDDFPSWYNPEEASQVFFYLNELYRLGVSKDDIGIITPYIKQVRQIRAILREAGFEVPKVGTVEEFQGLEYKVIIISTVRSCSEVLKVDKKFVLGFISNPRRFNVAMTRSQCLTIVIGNPHLLQADRHWGLVLVYCRKQGTYVGCTIK